VSTLVASTSFFKHLTLFFRLLATFDMHHCLRLTETLEAIFNFVFNSTKVFGFTSPGIFMIPLPNICPPYYGHDRHSILCLALTCRAFHGIALNFLYSHLNGIRSLTKSLSALELVLSDTLAASPVLTYEKFNSLVPNAARVKLLFMPYNHKGTSYAPKMA
jgi:hypothetical protein